MHHAQEFRPHLGGQMTPVSGQVQPCVLREYAFIADGEPGALIGPAGTIAWMCAPRWASPAVIAALLGGAGRYSVAPADSWHVWGGYYEGGSLIWCSRWVGDSVTECREALALPAGRHRCVILRRIQAADGPARENVVLDVWAVYGRDAMRSLKLAAGSWTGRDGQIRFSWSGASTARPDSDGVLAMTLDLSAGEHHDLVLELSDRPFDQDAPEPDAAWQATQEAWSSAVPGCDDLPAARDARHAYAPARPDRRPRRHGRGSHDLATRAAGRPAKLRLQGRLDTRPVLHPHRRCRAWPHSLLSGALRSLTEWVLEAGPELAPACTATGQPMPAERKLQLRGYPGGTAVAGNRVLRQFHLDCLSEIFQVMAAAAPHDMLAAENC